MDPVHLQRSRRLVLASGPNRSSLNPDLYAVLTDALTYYEKRFNYSAGPGDNIEMIDRRLYSAGPSPRTMIFPIGLRSRVANLLSGRGVPVVHVGGTLVGETRGTPADFIDWDGLFADFKIYPDQQSCLTKIISSDGGIVAAPTGAGKSVMLRMLCRMYSRARIHVVTKSATLADEIFSDLVTVVPDVGMYGGGKKNLRRVTVFVADSLHHGLGQADLVIADEIHELLAPKYSAALSRYINARIFGLSASPKGRMDNRDVIGEAICGPVIHEMDYQEAEAMGRVVPITVEWLRIPTGPDTAHLTNLAVKDKVAISQNAIRNQLIANRAKQFSPDEQVMIMVKTIDHAVHLKRLLPDFQLAYAANGMDSDRLQDYIKRGLLPADEPMMTQDRLRALRLDYASGKIKKVISNYVWSTGVNFKYLTVLIRADAAASKIRDIQIPGRVCRRVAGQKESALLIDCWDEWDDRLFRKTQSRSRNYREKGWTQIYTSASTGQQVTV